MDIPGFSLPGAPRTKKTSNRIIQIPKAGARKCYVCGHRPGFPKVLPSEAHEAWFKAAMPTALHVAAELARRGHRIPITAPVNVEALFYRDRLVGDAAGYYQALADLLQEAGIIKDDAQIESWDGSRRKKDSACPRIEVYLTVLEGKPVQQDLIEVTA